MPRGVKKKAPARTGVASAAPKPVEAQAEQPKKKAVSNAMVIMQRAKDKDQMIADGARVNPPRRTEFTNVQCTGESFDGENLQGINFKGSDFEDVTFIGADLRWCDFTGCKFTNCDFEGANLLEATDARGHVIDINGTSPA